MPSPKLLVMEIDFEDQTLQVHNRALDVGTAACCYIANVEDECDLAMLKNYYHDVIQTLLWSRSWRNPLKSEVLKYPQVLDPDKINVLQCRKKISYL